MMKKSYFDDEFFATDKDCRFAEDRLRSVPDEILYRLFECSREGLRDIEGDAMIEGGCDSNAQSLLTDRVGLCLRELLRRYACIKYRGCRIWPEAAVRQCKNIKRETDRIRFSMSDDGFRTIALVRVNSENVIQEIDSIKTFLYDEYSERSWEELETDSVLSDMCWFDQVMLSCVQCKGGCEAFSHLCSACEELLSRERVEQGLHSFLCEVEAARCGFLFTGHERWSHIVLDDLSEIERNGKTGGLDMSPWSTLLKKYCEIYDARESKITWECIWEGVIKGLEPECFDFTYERSVFYDRTRYMSRLETVAEAARMKADLIDYQVKFKRERPF